MAEVIITSASFALTVATVSEAIALAIVIASIGVTAAFVVVVVSRYTEVEIQHIIERIVS